MERLTSLTDFKRAILGLPSQSSHPRFLNTGSPGCLADNILGISDAVFPYLTGPYQQSMKETPLDQPQRFNHNG